MKNFAKSILCVMLFASFFAVISCGNISADNALTSSDGSAHSNSVRFTLPGKNSRAASAGGVDDVKYYNVYINDQSFENAQPGAAITSNPIAKGEEVRVTIEAYGNAKDAAGNVVVENSRIAYYTTTQTMPAENLSLQIRMSEYKTSYYRVSINKNNFDGSNTVGVTTSSSSASSYVAAGESYTLPDYGIAAPQGNDGPKKHTGWSYIDTSIGDMKTIGIGQSVTITSDTDFTLQFVEGVMVSFEDENGYSDTIKDLDISESIANGSIYDDGTGTPWCYYCFPEVPFTLPTANKSQQSQPGALVVGNSNAPVTSWRWTENNMQKQGTPGAKVTISSAIDSIAMTAQ